MVEGGERWRQPPLVCDVLPANQAARAHFMSRMGNASIIRSKSLHTCLGAITTCARRGVRKSYVMLEV